MKLMAPGIKLAYGLDFRENQYYNKPNNLQKNSFLEHFFAPYTLPGSFFHLTPLSGLLLPIFSSYVLNKNNQDFATNILVIKLPSRLDFAQF